MKGRGQMNRPQLVGVVLALAVVVGLGLIFAGRGAYVSHHGLVVTDTAFNRQKPEKIESVACDSSRSHKKRATKAKTPARATVSRRHLHESVNGGFSHEVSQPVRHLPESAEDTL